jgi:hypothetical protein
MRAATHPLALEHCRDRRRRHLQTLRNLGCDHPQAAVLIDLYHPLRPVFDAADSGDRRSINQPSGGSPGQASATWALTCGVEVRQDRARTAPQMDACHNPKHRHRRSAQGFKLLGANVDASIGVGWLSRRQERAVDLHGRRSRSSTVPSSTSLHRPAEGPARPTG